MRLHKLSLSTEQLTFLEEIPIHVRQNMSRLMGGGRDPESFKHGLAQRLSDEEEFGGDLDLAQSTIDQHLGSKSPPQRPWFSQELQGQHDDTERQTRLDASNAKLGGEMDRDEGVELPGVTDLRGEVPWEDRWLNHVNNVISNEHIVPHNPTSYFGRDPNTYKMFNTGLGYTVYEIEDYIVIASNQTRTQNDKVRNNGGRGTYALRSKAHENIPIPINGTMIKRGEGVQTYLPKILDAITNDEQEGQGLPKHRLRSFIQQSGLGKYSNRNTNDHRSQRFDLMMPSGKPDNYDTMHDFWNELGLDEQRIREYIALIESIIKYELLI